MKQRLNSSHLEMVGEKEIKTERAFLMKIHCSWETLSNCFPVACSGGKCDFVEVIIVRVMLLLLWG